MAASANLSGLTIEYNECGFTRMYTAFSGCCPFYTRIGIKHMALSSVNQTISLPTPNP
ncbi:hypothetical protein Mucpa_5035 [Mucilaginibacter paludis DSM 18603]|uniref:Uncharacterized protein n=1 Tax=Mucilaginibacter paludis DSM 18603 TaxID=714943 RepID=H1YAJ3_9SPHI|nr:hypothetical protein Mucpa_5035 [Mucilaginibacter paludis DSM 18603]